VRSNGGRPGSDGEGRELRRGEAKSLTLRAGQAELYFQWDGPRRGPSGRVVGSGGKGKAWARRRSDNGQSDLKICIEGCPGSRRTMHAAQRRATGRGAGAERSANKCRGFGQTTISWNAPGYTAVEVHSGAPDGPLVIAGGSSGSVSTGEVVNKFGLVLYLVDPGTQQTLATVDVTVLEDSRIVRAPERPGHPRSAKAQSAGDRPAGTAIQPN
jgi:hypothetical protein